MCEMKHFSKYADSSSNIHDMYTKQKISPSVHCKKQNHTIQNIKQGK
jgi:hypothetical protein